ncbi:ABC-F family ATP-binding cassette domain-containing protein [Sutcliffiella horikoshii]|uniref:ABC-F family ATP-binding cassette domain-containing protein n=1 Tax=Sutcliffiella horikoshii TaxID=79883 RepID=UPI001F327FFE|nr:ABC-F family ATP-binding cassette domain-containing protein [Sutcliffiella horikoshii]MCG1024025.1 ABC transporter ATP-binding protein [Sutcliffiella horikoshii]
MIILQVNQLTKYFGADLILSNIKLEVQSKDRIALVGRNGAGKSTLLKIISNQLSFDSGDLIKPKGVSIGYLAQDTGLQTERSIWDEMLTVFTGLRELETQMRTLEAKMGDPAYFEDETRYARILKEYDEVQEAFKQKGGFQYEADIRSVLHGLRFSEYDYQTPIETLSGGQRTRLALAKLLLTKPDLLILDEPTNHLDIDTLSWLENYLQGYPGALLIVSHDRYFLDKVVNIVYEISRKQSAKFIGNYSKYLEQKAEQYEREMKMFEKQQDEIAKLQDFVAKNLARASTTKRAQSRRRQLEKMDVMDRPKGDEKSASIMFDIDRQSGNDVLKARDLAVSYDTTPVFRHVDFSMSRGDSVALVGPNGIGKSTLLKTLVRKLKPLEGTFSFGANVSISYYDQQQADLTSNKTVLAELWDEYPQKMEKEIRTVLGNFLFSGDDVLKPVSTLSGGEKARLALSKLMMERSNVLILDEPTNHLDLDSKEILENALIDYPGTILFVSHDRYFINRLATKVYELSTVGATEYLGDYDYYVEKKEEALELERLEAETASSKASKVTSAATTDAPEKLSYEQEKEAKRLERQRKRRVEEIEKEMEELEQKIEHNESELCLPEVYQDHEKVLELNTANEAFQERLLALMEEWEELV